MFNALAHVWHNWIWNMNNIKIIFCILLVRVQNILKLMILKFFWRFKLMATIHWQINIYDQFYSFWTCQWSLCRTVMAISSRFFLCQSCFPSEKPTHCLPTCTSTPEELCGHAHFRRLSSHAPAPPFLVALCNTLASLSAILSRVTLGHCSWRYASNARLKDVESTATARVMCPDVYTFVCSCHSIARLKKKNPSDL